MTNTLRDHLISRHLNPANYRVFLDEENMVATFLLYNLSGQIIGYHVYRPLENKEKKNNPKDGRYYTYIHSEGLETSHREARKAIGVWGVETLNRRHGPLFLVEGVFDAVRLHNLGFAAIAALGNDVKKLKPWLTAMGRCVIVVEDGDSAGTKLGKLGHHSIKCPEGKDLGDMKSDEISQLLQKGMTECGINF